MKLFSMIVLLVSSLILVSGCSSDKAGLTSSKIRIVGANAFSASIGSAASNGLILYGRDKTGKSFTKIVSDDSTDLVFPNGTWSFYSVAWDQSNLGLNDKFRGTTKCAIKDNVVLNGTDVILNLSLSASTCASKKFVSPRITSCKNNGLVSSNAIGDCSQANNNKGYATWMRVAVPEYKKFDAGSFTRTGNAFRSFCIKVSASTTSGDVDTSSSSLLSLLSLPDDIPTEIEVFYSDDGIPCDGVKGVDVFVANTPKVKVYDDFNISPATRRYFVETNEGDVCKGPRVASSAFATGFGTTFHPYGICTTSQWNNIGGANFSSNNTKSFDLLSNLNFNNSNMMMIGDTNWSPSISYGGAYEVIFNGNGHKVEKGQINCSNSYVSGAGIFRSTNLSKIKNITFNGIINRCENLDSSGGVVGNATNTSFENVKFFGFVSGKSMVGGLVGSLTNNNTNYKDAILSSHVNAHISSKVTGSCGSTPNNAGGLVGVVSAGYSGSDSFSVKNSSFKGRVSSSCNNSVTNYPSYTGGIAGYVQNGWGANNVIFDQLVVKAELIEGSQFLGGFVGITDGMTIQDSYSSAPLSTTALSSSNIGGLIGFSTNSSSITKSFSADSFKKFTNGDSTVGGLVGSGNATCPDSYFINSSHISSLACGIGLSSSPYLSSHYTNYNSSIWYQPTPGHDYPRLRWEIADEINVEYLSRDCIGAGMFAPTPIGSGTFVDPYIICSNDQFINFFTTVSNKFYSLGKDLNFLGAALGKKPAGIYLLNGNGHTLSNFVLPVDNNSPSGIFSELNNFSIIQNLNIVGASVSSATTLSGVIFGLLSGENRGRIDNINILASDLILEDKTLAGSLIMGGIVGRNQVGGEILNSDINFVSKIVRLDNSNNYVDVFGGIAGLNNGEIRGVKVSSEIGRESDSSTNQLKSLSSIGSAVGENNNKLKEIEIGGNIKVFNASNSTDGKVGAIVARNSAGAVISDVKSQVNLTFTSYNPVSYLLIPSQLGSATRIIYNPGSSLAFIGSNFLTGLTNSICDAIANYYADCSSPVDYTASNVGLVVNQSSNSSTFTDWPVFPGLTFDSANIWRLMGVDSLNISTPKAPQLISASGSLDKIGKAFP